MEDFAVLIRNHAGITHGSMGGKADITKVWKLKRDSAGSDTMKPWTETEIEEITKSAQRQFAKIQEIKKQA